ncbi:MAG: UDP-N-acetylmuramoyl-L-alanyl-D-glutamate--2,6-diaminopimelate ligase [Pseudomonadota bacterium]
MVSSPVAIAPLIDALRTAGLSVEVSGSNATTFNRVTADSRQVQAGTMFAALKGVNVDGASFVPSAIAAGASAILTGIESALPSPTDGCLIIRVNEPRRALSLAAANLYPRQPGVSVAVTGTSGKTSVVDFTRQIMATAGLQAASVGTVGVIKPGGAHYGSLTTPDPVSLHQTLDELSSEGVTHLAFEASSHGLDQFRLDGVGLSAAAFTNLGRDHLDYHPTVEAYMAAKMRLFEELLQPGQPAVLNTDGAEADHVAGVCKARSLQIMTVGSRGDAIRLNGVRRDGFSQVLSVEIDGGSRDVLLPLVGGYQVENALVAAGLCLAVGLKADDVLAGLSQLSGVPGRLDIAGEARGGLAVIDYAHKPEALEAALAAVRPFVSGQLICVFGCGGDRDRGKRPIMGRIAAEKSDVVIVTDDNPRTEDAQAIRAEILADSPGAREIGDRRAAIRAGVDMLAGGDVLLVAGKGHETGQLVGDKVLPFSDHEEVAAAISAITPVA